MTKTIMTVKRNFKLKRFSFLRILGSVITLLVNFPIISTVSLDVDTEHKNTFPQLKNIFQEFKGCTIHLFRNQSVYTDLQLNFMHYLWVNIHLNFPLVQARYNFSKNSVLGTPWDLQYTSDVYQRIFKPTKHNTSCTILMPVSKSADQYTLEKIFFGKMTLFKEYGKRNSTLYTADYIILPIKIPDRNIHEVAIQTNKFRIN